jgi:Ca2+/Na+ antiporter
MIGTAFYALGVIACMIVIVAVAVAAIAGLSRLFPFILLAAVLVSAVWLVGWMGLTSLLLVAVLGAAFLGLKWLFDKLDRDDAARDAQKKQRRWEEVDRKWNEQ